MLGHIRLILAHLVLISHLGITVQGMNPGVTAVVMFYILAGSVITHLWDNVIHGSAKLRRYYVDRLKRIFPLYIYALLLTALFILLTGYGDPDWQWSAIIYNLTLLPLNFFMYLNTDIITDPSWNLIPPAWSVGAELQAYLLVPLLLIWPRLAATAFILSFIVYTLANLGVLHADHYGYRLLPGVLFIFLTGTLIRRATASVFYQRLLAIVWLVILINMLLLWLTPLSAGTYTRETLTGLIVGIPLIWLANQYSRKLPLNNLSGTMSYGIFLMHFLAIWLLDWGLPDGLSGPLYVLIIVCLTWCLAWPGVQFIDQRINGYRYKKQ